MVEECIEGSLGYWKAKAEFFKRVSDYQREALSRCLKVIEEYEKTIRDLESSKTFDKNDS